MNKIDDEKFILNIVKLFLYYLIFIMFFGGTFPLLSYLVGGDSELILDFYIVYWGAIIFSLVFTIILGELHKSMTLTTVGYRFSVFLNITVQLGISFSSSYLWILICGVIMEICKEMAVFNGLLEVRYTLFFLMIAFIGMLITSGILFRCSSTLNNYFLNFFTSEYLVLSSIQIKKILSSTYAEKIYGIMTIFVTIAWLNNDNLSMKNSTKYFETVFNTDLIVLGFSLSVYVNYVITLFFKRCTN